MIDLTFLTFVLFYLLEYETELQAAASKLEFQVIGMGLQVHITTNDDHCTEEQIRRVFYDT